MKAIVKFKNKIVNCIEAKRGELIHVDTFDSLMQDTAELLNNWPNEMSDELKATKGFRITVTIEHN